MVTRVLVEPGQWVARRPGAGDGRPLGADADRPHRSPRRSASRRPMRRLAQSELDRAQALVGRGFISKADIDRKTATRDAADARGSASRRRSLPKQRARNGRLDIRAPAAGLVLTRSVEPGQIVSSGSRHAVPHGQGRRDGDARAVERSRSAGAARRRAAPRSPRSAQRQAFTGKVWQVSPVIDPQTRQGIARIALPYDPALRPGGFAAATIRRGIDRRAAAAAIGGAERRAGQFRLCRRRGQQGRAPRVKIGDVSDAASRSRGPERHRAGRAVGRRLPQPGQKVKPILPESARLKRHELPQHLRLVDPQPGSADRAVLLLTLAGIVSFSTMDVNNNPDIDFPVGDRRDQPAGRRADRARNPGHAARRGGGAQPQGIDEINSTVTRGQFAHRRPVRDRHADRPRRQRRARARSQQIRSDLPDGILEPQVVARRHRRQTISPAMPRSATDMTIEQLSWYIDNTVVEGTAVGSRHGRGQPQRRRRPRNPRDPRSGASCRRRA